MGRKAARCSAPIFYKTNNSACTAQYKYIRIHACSHGALRAGGLVIVEPVATAT